MLKFILINLLILFSFQFLEKEFYVKEVFVASKYNSRYILTYANQLIPSEKKVKLETVQCLVENLKESGIFQDIKTELMPLGNDEYKLIITPTYKPNVENFVINEIKLDKSFGINEEVFLEKLKEKNITLGTPFQPYTEIEVGIVDVIEELYNQQESEEALPKVWIKLNLIDNTNLSLSIMSEFPSCCN